MVKGLVTDLNIEIGLVIEGLASVDVVEEAVLAVMVHQTTTE